ncbi:hypothetical protein [Methanonatronarchaeum sp. AMET-Sl]|uniref:hypothetical protein n=1 Tax=Methanonatronarchaeum sp. AMET-Sl TaxID=3037654 RepID=UPI00244DD97B|nr:hypothetical protein [Methanonatronarchaeum sp. AMET-Sl]WGI17675.1 hypothetical protein QEN48_01310 [Methanonatronarchaeum sp. AMET-Sl]
MSFAGVPFEEEAIELIILLAETGALEELPEAAQAALEDAAGELPDAAIEALENAEPGN